MTNDPSVTTPESAVNPWLRICITGGIACGKSMVGAWLAELGVAVIEADAVCHDLMRPGMPLYARIVADFGRGIVASDGRIDRAALGRCVFGDAKALERLNAILHPAALAVIETWTAARRREFCVDGPEPRGHRQPGSAATFPVPPERSSKATAIENRKTKAENPPSGWPGGVVAIIPLLYETGREADWDTVICVGAPVALQRERLRSKGFMEKEAHDRLAAQWPVEEKMKRADYVVFNGGTQMCAQWQIVRVMQHIGIHLEKCDGR